MSKLKIIDRGFEIVCLCAFRYAVNRHCTECMNRGFGDGDTIENVILDNLDHINSGFKCQMMRDILMEFEWYDNLDAEEKWGEKHIETETGYTHTYYSPHYLDHMFNALKEDYKNTHDGAEWQEGIQI